MTNQQRHRPNQRKENRPELNVSRIQFKNKTADLFDEVAHATAKTISQCGKEMNKSTQLRRYYDEIDMWEQKIRQNPEKYLEYTPFIKMINAKVAYAKGRKLVDSNFAKLMRHCIEQIEEDDINSFYTFKLFFEAFMGFYKMYQPK